MKMLKINMVKWYMYIESWCISKTDSLHGIYFLIILISKHKKFIQSEYIHKKQITDHYNLIKKDLLEWKHCQVQLNLPFQQTVWASYRNETFSFFISHGKCLWYISQKKKLCMKFGKWHQIERIYIWMTKNCFCIQF